MKIAERAYFYARFFLLNSAILPAHGAQAVAVLQRGIDARAAAEAVLTARGRGRRGCHFLHAHRALVTLRVFRMLRAHVLRQGARLAERSGAVGAHVVLALLVHDLDVRLQVALVPEGRPCSRGTRGRAASSAPS